MTRFVFFAALASLACAAHAQQLELPRLSPSAKTTQTAGLTDITVEYSSPAVKGRTIWGALVPWDKLWRAGANAPTKLTVSRDVKIGGKAVPAGSYALFVIPSAKGPWTVIVNKDTEQPGIGAAYKQELDVLRAQVKPQAIAGRERLRWSIGDFSDDAAPLELEWEKVKLSLPIQLGTREQAQASIKSVVVDGAWRPWNQAARYDLEIKAYDEGLALVEQSLKIKEDWYNLWTRAQLRAGKAMYNDALADAARAKELGDKSKGFFAADDVAKALVDWKTAKNKARAKGM